MRARFLLILLVLAVMPVFASPAEGVDPARFLGMDVTAAVAALGLPHDLFTFRGSDEKRDNVVFYYPDSLYLFWFRNRVWQVRFDRRYTAPVLGISLGMSRDEIERSYARKLVPSGDSLYFDLDPESYPVRVRLVFDAGILVDLYIYRSDY